jgi:hypothetical protein
VGTGPRPGCFQSGVQCSGAAGAAWFQLPGVGAITSAARRPAPPSTVALARIRAGMRRRGSNGSRGSGSRRVPAPALQGSRRRQG